MKTYRDLLLALQELTDEQLSQDVQVCGPYSSDKPLDLLPVYAFADIETLFHSDDECLHETRSAVDGKHHPEQLVLCADYHPFDKDGNSAYQLTDDGMIGNKTGKTYTCEELDNL